MQMELNFLSQQKVLTIIFFDQKNTVMILSKICLKIYAKGF